MSKVSLPASQVLLSKNLDLNNHYPHYDVSNRNNPENNVFTKMFDISVNHDKIPFQWHDPLKYFEKIRSSFCMCVVVPEAFHFTSLCQFFAGYNKSD